MDVKQYIGLFLMLLMLGSAFQPAEQYRFDADIELTDTMDSDAKDNFEKELISDLFLVDLNANTFMYNFNLKEFKIDDLFLDTQGYDDIILPPPEC